MLSMTLVRRYPVAVFFGASVSIGWIVTIAAARLPGGTALLPLVAIPVSYVPAAAALVVLRVAGTEDDKRALRRRLTTVRVDKRWYAVALLVPPLIHLSGVALATLAGGTFAIQPAMFALLPLFLITSLGEEIGWRGYAQPKLQERMTPLAAAIVVGLGWAAFHWVALLANAETPLAYVIVSTFQLMALSIILAILFNEGRQALILVVLAHAMYDTASDRRRAICLDRCPARRIRPVRGGHVGRRDRHAGRPGPDAAAGVPVRGDAATRGRLSVSRTRRRGRLGRDFAGSVSDHEPGSDADLECPREQYRNGGRRLPTTCSRAALRHPPDDALELFLGQPASERLADTRRRRDRTPEPPFPFGHPRSVRLRDAAETVVQVAQGGRLVGSGPGDRHRRLVRVQRPQSAPRRCTPRRPDRRRQALPSSRPAGPRGRHPRRPRGRSWRHCATRCNSAGQHR